MQTTLPKLTLLKLQGESYDLGQCFNARDEHFDCMDQFRSVKGSFHANLHTIFYFKNFYNFGGILL